MTSIGQHISSSAGSGGGVSLKPQERSYESNSDDHHVSFSKNGTDIEFDGDSDKSNTQIFNIFVPKVRSNSLTIGTKPHEQLATFNSSTENLCFMKNQRSFSLSGESPRSSLISSGSETRLDDFKVSYDTFQTKHVGMSNLPVWLKELRLHKYVWLFKNRTYEQMMAITDDDLCAMQVTKGARTKLIGCIQKLKDRHAKMTELEQSLRSGTTTIATVLEELNAIVKTPMKPADLYNPEDVAGHFFNVVKIGKYGRHIIIVLF